MGPSPASQTRAFAWMSRLGKPAVVHNHPQPAQNLPLNICDDPSDSNCLERHRRYMAILFQSGKWRRAWYSSEQKKHWPTCQSQKSPEDNGATVHFEKMTLESMAYWGVALKSYSNKHMDMINIDRPLSKSILGALILGPICNAFLSPCTHVKPNASLVVLPGNELL